MYTAKRPILLGIVGDSAAGKTTISRGLTRVLGETQCTHVCTDDYHKYDRNERKERNISALHPDCNYIDIMQLHVERLHYGQPILKPVYDHSNGTLVRPEYIRPQQFVIAEGLLGFATPTLRNFYDVKVFLKPVEPLRTVWKIKRDTTKRGYTREQVLEALHKREHDSATYIRTQEREADIVVTFYPPDGVDLEETNAPLNVRLVLRPTIPHPDLSYLLDDNSRGIRLKLGRDHGLPVDFLEIDGNVSFEQAHKIAEAIWKHMPDLQPVADELIGNYEGGEGDVHSSPLAITQLLIAYHLLRKYQNRTNIPFATPVAALSRLSSNSNGTQPQQHEVET